MELDRKILGRAYVGRIKAYDIYGGVDQLYGIVYKSPKEELGHELFKSICATHNQKYFYSKTINKKTPTFTMRECLDTMVNFPKIGTSGLSMLDYPMTFSGFGRLAYEQNILSSASGYALLDDEGEAEPNDEMEEVFVPIDERVPASKVRKSIQKKVLFNNMMRTVRKQAVQFKDVANYNVSALPQGEQLLLTDNGSVLTENILDEHDIPVVGMEEVVAPSNDGFSNISMEALKDRCVLAEANIEKLEAVVAEKDAQIDDLKKKLGSAVASSEKFMSAAGLADAQRREYRADNASEVVDGLKNEFDNNDEQVLVLTEIVQSHDDLPRKLMNFADGVQKSLSSNVQLIVNEVKNVLLDKQVGDSSCPKQLLDRGGFSIQKFTDYVDNDDEVEVIDDDDEDSSGQSIQSVHEVVRPGVIVGPASQGSYGEPISNMKQSENNEDKSVKNNVGGNGDAANGHAGNNVVSGGGNQGVQGGYLLQEKPHRNSTGILPHPPSVNNNNKRSLDVWIHPPLSFKRGPSQLNGSQEANQQRRF